MLHGWREITLRVVALVTLTPPVGGYTARVYANVRVFLTPVLGSLEWLLYRVTPPTSAAARNGSLRAQSASLLGPLLAGALSIVRARTLHYWPRHCYNRHVAGGGVLGARAVSTQDSRGVSRRDQTASRAIFGPGGTLVVEW
jgi:hypothetical protein